MSKLIITAIEKGIVIDHIQNSMTQKIFSLININHTHEMISMAFNLKSNLLGLKGIIKIENKKLSQREIDIISVLSPKSTINIIENGKIKEKIPCKIPKKINNIFICKTHKCISNNERSIPTIFSLNEDNGKIIANCDFCERIFNIDELEVKDDK